MTRTVGVISKIDQVTDEPKSLAAVQSRAHAAQLTFLGLGSLGSLFRWPPHNQVGAENSVVTAWRAESESLKSILSGTSPSKPGRVALVDVLGKQIRNRLKVGLPNVLTGYVSSLLNAS